MLTSKATLASLSRSMNVISGTRSTCRQWMNQTDPIRFLATLRHSDNARLPQQTSHLNHVQPAPFLSTGELIARPSRRQFSVSSSTLKAYKPAVTDMRDTDIEIDPDEIEFVGRKLRRFQVRGLATSGEVWRGLAKFGE